MTELNAEQADAVCPTCGPTTVEPHPRRRAVTRCTNCKEWMTAANYALVVPPAVRCDTCGDTRRMLWAIEADPNLYQEVDEDGMVPCIDCALPPDSGDAQ